MLISSGDMKERVTVLQEVVTPGEGTAVSKDYVEGTALWAKVWALRSEEVPQAKQVQGGTFYEITIRDPLPDGVEIKGSGRLLWRGRTLHLQGPPAKIGADPFLKILAVEKES